MYTVDTSVWVNSFDQREPGHAISRQVLNLLAVQAAPIIVPYLLLVEVAGAISRTRQNPGQAESFATALSQLPNVVFKALDETLGGVALDWLRSMVYVALMPCMPLSRARQGAH